ALADRLQTGLIDPPGGELLVICRPAGWQVLEWAASVLAALPGAQFLRVAGLAESAPAASVLASLTTEAPLREAYQVMAATVDDVSGKVKAPARIFLSYRREDTRWAAGRLFDRLSYRFGKDQVFKDIDSIQLGDDFVDAITSAVGSCDVLLALIGDRWLTT